MNPEEMKFALWETSGDEARRPTLRVQLDGREFLLQLADDFLRFCEPSSPRVRSSPREWNFAVRERVRVSSGTVVNPDFLRSLFEDEWRQGHVGRLVFVEEAAVFLGRDGTGWVCSPGRGGNSSFSYGKIARQIPFRFPFEGDFDSHPATLWREKVEALDADESSDLRFARELAGEAGNDLARLVCSIGGAGWSEMESVARGLLRFDRAWDSPGYAHCWHSGVRVQLRRDGQPRLELVCAEDLWDDMQHHHYDLAHKATKLWQVWLREFVRGFDEDKLAPHLGGEAIRECGFVITDERRQPSAHEQMEVVLELRDWLKGKLPAQEIEALLR